MCTTILPLGKSRCKKLPMIIASAPDIFQEVMNRLLWDLDYVTPVYVDGILIIQKEDKLDESHLETLAIVLGRQKTWI